MPTYDVNSPVTPWSGVSTQNRARWYDPILRERYVRQSVYSRHVDMRFTPKRDSRAKTTSFTNVIAPKPNTNAADPRQLFTDASYMDSYEVEVDFSTYVGKFLMHAEDEIFSYWNQDNEYGIQPIIEKSVAQMIVDQNDILARNAYLEGSIKTIGAGRTSFNDLTSNTAGDKLTLDVFDAIGMGMGGRSRPYMNLHVPQSPDAMFVITTIGAWYDFKKSLEGQTNRRILNVSEYRRIAVPGEIGTFDNFRFVTSPLAVLNNAGPIVAQHAIKLPINAGDGAPDPKDPTKKVMGVYKMGQPDRVGIKYYIELAAVTDLAVNDEVTIHVARTNAFGVTNGVDWRDSKTVTRRIVAIDGGAMQIQVDKPLMEDYTADLGGTVYGYVTKGRNVHTTTVIAGNQGVLCAVADPTYINKPKFVDDFGLLWAVAFRGRYKYQQYQPEDFHVHFSSGSDYRFNTGIVTT